MSTIGTTNIKFSEIYNVINDNDHNGTDNIAISDFRGTDYYVGGAVPNTGAISIGTHFKNKNFQLAFSSHTFKSCGASKLETSGSSTGGRRYGPTLAECRAEYTPTWVDDDANFNIVTPGIQEWTVPETGIYKIIAKGAAGGYAGKSTSKEGGFGAVIEGNFSLIMNQKIQILVGQLGETYRDIYNIAGGGGGGGTFVVKKNSGGLSSTTINDVLIVAGGGGGSNHHGSDQTTPDMNAILGNTTSTVGGSTVSYGSGGGGGLIGNGIGAGKGYSFIGGGVGGIGGHSNNTLNYRNYGGFGGGGGNGAHAGGGGGGMSGGSTTQFQNYQGGYGGGSYNTGTSQSAIVNTTVADGEVTITLITNLYVFSSHTFKSCGASKLETSGSLTGGRRYGPTLAECRAEYTPTWVDDDANFNIVTPGIQEWTVPETGIYKIIAKGAAGGYAGKSTSKEGGFGAVIEGNFSLIMNQKIQILVGQLGETYRDIYNIAGGGGGGGTFVVKKNSGGLSSTTINDVLIVAGGGGGSNHHGSDQTTPDMNAILGNTTSTVGGSTVSYGSGGGGGLIGNGIGAGKGYSFIGGGVGGIGGHSNNTLNYRNYGGFGGGGGNGAHAGGGGGGMSGGSTTQFQNYQGGYGGGSYNTGTSQSAIVNTTVADGEVIITLIESGNLPGDISVIQNYGAHDIAYINCTSVTDFNNRTFLGYISKFGVTGTSTNNDSTQWQNGYSGTSATPISYDAKPLKSGNDYFLDNGDYGLRFIHGDGSADGPDWCVIDFGPLNNGDFDGLYQNTKGRFFGGENTASGGGGGIYTSSSNKGMLWGFNNSDGWKLLYQLPLGVRDSNYNKSTGKWFTSGGTYVTSGDGKRAEYDTMVLTHVGFSVGTP
uniref:receptor protein-tyrosine kinase n=1 Tax=viral metagenome TaxID=1070528 RepID=A0A6C0F715_9ZZZZ